VRVAKSPKVKDSVSVSFGAAVRSFRKQRNFSQEELAERAGLHRTYVADIERGARNLSLSSIARLARALDVSTGALLSHAGKLTAPIGVQRRDSLAGEMVDILLVDDNPRDIELALSAFDHARVANPVHVVSDGAQAMDFLFCSGPYQNRVLENRLPLVLLSLKLPRVSGLEILRRIKGDPRTKAVPVVVLAETQQERESLEWRRLGAESCIVRPVGFSIFCQALAQSSLRWALIGPAPAGKS
jgi:transcriptional regulator with XRE-family HTH domain